jgi:hypothetical protein
MPKLPKLPKLKPTAILGCTKRVLILNGFSKESQVSWAGGSLFDLGFLSLQFRADPEYGEKQFQETRRRGEEQRGVLGKVAKGGLGAKVLSMAPLSDEINHES